jgi:hypothetical protein
MLLAFSMTEMGACPKLVSNGPGRSLRPHQREQQLTSLTTILHYHYLDLSECLPEQVATIMSQTQVVQTDSIEDDDPHGASEKKQKTRRPASAQDLCAMHCFAERISDIVARV